MYMYTYTHTHTHTHIYIYIGSPLHISPHLLSAMTSSSAERLAGGGEGGRLGGVVDLTMDAGVERVRHRVRDDACMFDARLMYV